MSKIFDSKNFPAAKGLKFTLDAPVDYSEFEETPEGLVAGYEYASESGDSYLYVTIAVEDLPEGFPAGSLKKEDGTFDRDKVNALWESVVKKEEGTLTKQSWGKNPSADIFIKIKDGEISKINGLNYTLKDDKIVVLNCGYNSFGDGEDDGEGDPESDLPGDCAPFFKSLKFQD
jgi:hypothetical protein